MKKVSLVAASVLALGWATAQAQTGASVGAGVDSSGVSAGASAGSDTPTATDTAKAPAGSTTVTAPNATVTAPPGSTTTITAPAPSATAATPGTPSTLADPATTTTPAAPTTNIEVKPPASASDSTAAGASSDATSGDTTSTDTTTATGTTSDSDNVVVEQPPVQPVPVQPMPATAYDNRYVEKQYTEQRLAPKVGVGLLVGGGFQDFTGNNIRGVTGSAGYWNARVVLGTRQFVGFEGAYIGTAQDISALGLASNAMLISNGAEGALRVNVPIANGRSLIEPFGFVGAGWSRFHVARSATNTSDIATNDDVLTVPYGAGLALGYAGFMADARFTYRSTFYEDLLRTTGGGLDNWSVGGQLGFEF